MEAEEWGEKTPRLDGDLGGKKILDAKAPVICEGISGIRRLEAQELRSKLCIEAKIAAE